MWTRLRPNLLQLEHHVGFAKIDQMNHENSPQQISFAFSIHSDTRTKSYRLRRIPTSLHRCILL